MCDYYVEISHLCWVTLSKDYKNTTSTTGQLITFYMHIYNTLFRQISLCSVSLKTTKSKISCSTINKLQQLDRINYIIQLESGWLHPSDVKCLMETTF